VAGPELIARLRSGRTPRQRADAAQELAAVDSKDVVMALVEALGDPDPEVRVDAGIALASLRDPATIPVLAAIVARWTAPALTRPRGAALRTLVAFRSPQAAVTLARALAQGGSDPSPDLNDRSALLAVVHAEPGGTAGPLVVRALAAMLSEAHERVAERAGGLLELFPADIPGPLVRVLRTAKAPAVRRRAVRALRACRSSEAVAALIGALSDPAPEVRAEAARVLQDVRDPAAVEALHDAAGDSDEDVRRTAEAALGALGAVATAAGMASRFAPLPNPSA
jgi:HEAT repeat protein